MINWILNIYIIFFWSRLLNHVDEQSYLIWSTSNEAKFRTKLWVSAVFSSYPWDSYFSSPFLGLKTTSNIVRDQVIWLVLHLWFQCRSRPIWTSATSSHNQNFSSFFRVANIWRIACVSSPVELLGAAFPAIQAELLPCPEVACGTAAILFTSRADSSYPWPWILWYVVE